MFSLTDFPRKVTPLASALERLAGFAEPPRRSWGVSPPSF